MRKWMLNKLMLFVDKHESLNVCLPSVAYIVFYMERKSKLAEEEMLLNKGVKPSRSMSTSQSKWPPMKWYDSWSNLNCMGQSGIIYVCRWISLSDCCIPVCHANAYRKHVS